MRFVTYTTKYNNAHWVTVELLEESYKRADVDAKRTDDLKQYTVTTKNVARVRFEVPAASFTIDGQTLKARRESGVREDERQVGGGYADIPSGLRKIHGLQGPIEDAFTEGFLAVRGTGQPWNEGRAQLREPALRQLQVGVRQVDARRHSREGRQVGVGGRYRQLQPRAVRRSGQQRFDR